MKLIKKGNPDPDWPQELECTGAGNSKRGCGAILEVERSDIFQTENHARDDTSYFLTFKCCDPECGALTDLSKDLIRQLKLNIADFPTQRTWESNARKQRKLT